MGLEWGVFLALLMFAIFMFLILTGYNVAFSFASVSVAFAFVGDLTGAFRPGALASLGNLWFGAISDATLLAVPLFVLMGAILERSGLAERLLNAIGLLMGPLRGGVAAAVVIVGTLLAAATGVVAATVIVMGLLSLPAMMRLGYDAKLATGAITASGTLAQLLPPSIVLILLANQLGVGILGLFAGALLPGLMLSGMYVAYVLGISALKPHLGPVMPPEERTLAGNPSLGTKAILSLILAFMVFLVLILRGASPGTEGALAFALTWSGAAFLLFFGFMAATKMLGTEVIVSIVPTIALIVGVLFSIFQGIASPSESGAVGVFGALILTVLNRLVDKQLVKEGADHIQTEWQLTPKALRAAGVSTANITILVMTLLFCSSFFRLMFRELGGADQVSDWLSSVGGGKWGFVLIAMVAVFLLGINLEFLEITFIVVPIFVPAMQELAFTDAEIIWFAMLMAVNLNMAFISPPVGFSLFYLQSVAPPEVKTADIHKGAIPFMVIQGIALVILGIWDEITFASIRLFSDIDI
ncbi:MAG: TRAP transporter large permease subunit [Acidimicrobiales bacterium]|nr:TRAP transporter large permease subunit [Acidimicrobiales bacterium]